MQKKQVAIVNLESRIRNLEAKLKAALNPEEDPLRLKLQQANDKIAELTR